MNPGDMGWNLYEIEQIISSLNARNNHMKELQENLVNQFSNFESTWRSEVSSESCDRIRAFLGKEENSFLTNVLNTNSTHTLNLKRIVPLLEHLERKGI